MALQGEAAAGLLGALWRSAARHGGASEDVMLANVIGLLSQSHEATAALHWPC